MDISSIIGSGCVYWELWYFVVIDNEGRQLLCIFKFIIMTRYQWYSVVYSCHFFTASTELYTNFCSMWLCSFLFYRLGIYYSPILTVVVVIKLWITFYMKRVSIPLLVKSILYVERAFLCDDCMWYCMYGTVHSSLYCI